MQRLANVWYVAALATEVEVGQLFPRRIADEPVVMFRDRHGVAHALRDRCPHRFAPLHRGKLRGDRVECGYHGLQFDGSGTCVHNPHGEGRIPQAAVVRTYPVAERHGLLWIWVGEPSSADSTEIPDYSFVAHGHPNALSTGYLLTQSNYQLVSDNITDLSHADFLHSPILNSLGAITHLIPKVADDGRSVTIEWDYGVERAQGLFDQFLPAPGKPARQTLKVTWQAPALMRLIARAMQGDEGPDYLEFDTLHLMTPETETTTHYFFLGRRNFRDESPELQQAITAGLMSAFTNEDKPMLNAVQESMGTPDLWALNPVLLTCDSGAVRCRRVLQRLLASEQQAVNQIPGHPSTSTRSGADSKTL
jgi:phenylpropionate dioxygenase-like ring-hydroxylating dioxygenase large terminal subunit